MGSIMFLYGPESYLIDFYRNKAVNSVPEELRAMSVSEAAPPFTAEVSDLCNTPSLFSGKRVVLMQADDIKAFDVPAFHKYMEAPCSRTELVITLSKKPDSRLKFVKELKKAGVLKSCDKLDKESALQQTFLYEIKKSGARITADAMQEFTRRINYFAVEDMTLLKAVSYLRNAISLGNGEVTVDVIRNAVPEFQAEDVFGVAGLLKQRDMDGLLAQARLIPEKNAIAASSALLREFRLSYKRKYYSLKETGAWKEPAFTDMDKDSLLSCIGIITDAIAGVKSGLLSSEDLLQSVFVQLMTVLEKTVPAA